MKKLLSFLLSLTLLITPALASQAMGWELVRSQTVLGPGVSLTTQSFWGDSRSDYRAEQFATYTPGQGAFPVVTYGAAVPEKATLTAMAKGLESLGHRVLAGANGDYFVVATGVPLGMVVTWGVLRSSSSYLPAVGFDTEGNAVIGKPELTVWAGLKGQRLAVSGGYNKSRVAADGLTLFNRDFGAATKGAGEGVNVILRPVEIPEGYEPPVYQAPDLTPPEEPLPVTDPDTGEVTEPSEEDLAAYEEAKTAYEAAVAAAQGEYEAALAQWGGNLPSAPARLTIGGAEVTCVVTGASTQSGAVAIPEGCFILTAHVDSGAYLQTQLAALKPGEQVTLSVTSPDPRWSEVQQAIGGYQLLLKDGVVQEGLDNAANPRTALGVKADGSVILYTVDGRRAGHSVGASMRQAAARLKELGCVDAVLLDGGGSTTFGATGAVDNAFTLQNKPSDGAQRAVSNALFFVSNLEPTGELGSLYLTPQSGLLLPGGKVTLSAQGIDTNYHPMAGSVGEVIYTSAPGGEMAGRVFTAGAVTEKTEVEVTGSVSGRTGTTRLTVVPTPHAITLADEATGQTVTSLNLDPGQSVGLTASAAWYGLPMTASDDCFTWSVPPEVGTVDAAGTLTAGAKAAVGSVTVTAGGKSASLPVTVAGHVEPLADLEGAESPFQGAAELTATQVKYGRQALKAFVTPGENDLTCELPLVAGETDVTVWAYPEQPGTARFTFRLTDGQTASTEVPLGEPGQWSPVRAVLPADTAALTGLTLISEVEGAVYLDHLTSSNGGILDETPPTAQLTYDVEKGTVRAVLSDNVDKTFAKERISLTLDGKPLDFTLTGNTVTAQGDEATYTTYAVLHRVSLTVSDASGNLARASAQAEPVRDASLLPEEAILLPPVFEDAEGHWARDYAEYLYFQKIVQGIPTKVAALRFEFNTNITRGDFVTMLMRWLGTDLSQYADVALPFVDADTIQPWALEAVKGAYALGIFTGSGVGEVVYANANDPITRAQAMALLGRVQPKGFAPSAETFLDQADIPDWAAEHVAVLVGQGVVQGFGGYVRPNDPMTRAEVAKVLTVMQ